MGIAAMVASIKFNNRRNKRQAFNRSIHSDTASEGIKIEPVSKETMEKIRKKMRKQNRVYTIKSIIIISTSILITAWLVFKVTSKI